MPLRMFCPYDGGLLVRLVYVHPWKWYTCEYGHALIET